MVVGYINHDQTCNGYEGHRMIDSIAIGADGHANHVLAILRNGDHTGDLSQDVTFLPGLKLNADPALALSGQYTSPAGWLLQLDVQIDNPGSWVGLHLDLPANDLSHVGVIGFAARIAGPEVLMARACLRSGSDSGFVDCFFDKHLLFRPEETSHLDAVSVAQRMMLPVQAPWRELILFLPTESFTLSLIDLRVFVV